VDPTDVVVRVLLAAVLGGLLGLEREVSDQPAGLRTHILVSLGAALFTIAGAYGAEALTGTASTRVDPTRVAAQVVTGVGFLGAGAILQQGLSIRGLTTAASLWVTAAVGTAIGLGSYVGAAAVVVVTLAVLMGLKPLEERLLARFVRRRRRLLVAAGGDLRLGELKAALEDAGVAVGGLRIMDEGAHEDRLLITVSLPRHTRPPDLLGLVRGVSGVRVAEWYS
jgi:putative Mg2+ transporter-C (MgtC) family protein